MMLLLLWLLVVVVVVVVGAAWIFYSGGGGFAARALVQFFPRGEDKEAQDYNGGREGEDFVEFLNKAAGTKRVLGGGLTPDAARLPAFDALAKKFVAGYVV